MFILFRIVHYYSFCSVDGGRITRWKVAIDGLLCIQLEVARIIVLGACVNWREINKLVGSSSPR